MKENVEISKLEKFVRGCIRKRQYEILIGVKKQFHFDQVKKPATAIFFKHDLQKFETVVYNYYKKYKSYWSSKFYRIERNKYLVDLQEKYPDVEIMFIAKYLTMKNKFELQKKSDILILEDIIKIVHCIPLYNEASDKHHEKENEDLIMQ